MYSTIYIDAGKKRPVAKKTSSFFLYAESMSQHSHLTNAHVLEEKQRKEAKPARTPIMYSGLKNSYFIQTEHVNVRAK